MKGFDRLTIRAAVEPELVRSLRSHNDPVLDLEFLILRANLEVMYSSARNATTLLDLAAASPQEAWAQIRPQFAWAAKHGRAHVFEETGRSAESMAAAAEAIEFAETAGLTRLSAMSRSMLGQALSRQGYSGDAAFTLVSASEEALAAERKLGLAEYYLARTYEQVGDIDGSVRQLAKAVDSPVARLLIGSYQIELARLLGKVGRAEEAASALAVGRTMVRLRGAPAKVRNRYLLADAQICLATGDFKKAARRAEWATQGFERGGFLILELTARLLLAEAQLRLGNPTAAIEVLQSVKPAIDFPFARLEAAQILSECYHDVDDLSNEVQQLREVAKLAEQLRRSAHAISEVERLVAAKAQERLKAMRLEAERDELQMQHIRNSEAISLVCHDLRSSLAIVTLAAETLTRATAGPKPKRRLFDSIEAMDHLVTQLNSVSELDRTMRQLSNQAFDANDLCWSIVGRLLPLAATRNIALSVSEQGPENAVAGDTKAVERIVINFITNAINHCPTGTIVDVRCATVGPTTVRVSVVDDGPGIDGDDMAQVFDKFVSGAGRTEPASTGLGLYIARQLAHSMGGEVGVEPGDDGSGCCFWLELPVSEFG